MYKSALLIWLRTNLLNAIFITMGAMFISDFIMIIVFPVVFVVGGTISSPLIIVIARIIKQYVALNYHPVDKFYWFMFSTMLLAVVFLLLLLMVLQISLSQMDQYVRWIIASVILSTSLAVRLTKSSLTCLNIIYHEKLMV